MENMITFTRIFSDYHIKKGQPTYFVEQLLNNFISQSIECSAVDVEAQLGFKLLPDFRTKCGSKGHTIRSRNDWKVGDKFSVGIWLDRPYISKIIKIAAVEVKKVWTFDCDEHGLIKVNGFVINQEQMEELAKNDGLSLIDFEEWIVTPCRITNKAFKGQVICWDESISYELPKFELQS